MTKKKRGCLRIVLRMAVVFVVLVLVWAAVNFRPTVRDGTPLIVVSVETTGIVSPLDANGDVDYFEALDLVMSEGVTPEANAVVRIVEGWGPEFDGPLSDDFFVRLAMERPPAEGDYFVDYSQWLFEQGKTTERYAGWSSVTEYGRQFDFGMGNPWNEEQCPDLAEWRRQMQHSFAIIREGIQRPDWYCPSISDNDVSSRLLATTNLFSVEMRELLRFLRINAFWHLQRDEVVASFDDALDAYRLANHLGKGAKLVDGLVAVALHSMANDLVVTICRSRKATPHQLKEFLVKLETVSTPGDISQSLEWGERFLAFDVVVSLGRGASDVNDWLHLPETQDESGAWLLGIAMATVDWSETMVVVKSWSDRLIEVSKGTDYRWRQAAYRQIADEIAQLQVSNKHWGKGFLTTIGGRKAKGRLVGEILVGMLMPNAAAIDGAEFRSRVLLDMTKIMVGLAAYEKENGQYPENLEQLVPEFFEEIPLDRYTNAPFQYDVKDSEVVLYSVGDNRIDENGKYGYSKNGEQNDDWMLEGQIRSWEEFIEENKFP